MIDLRASLFAVIPRGSAFRGNSPGH